MRRATLAILASVLLLAAPILVQSGAAAQSATDVVGSWVLDLTDDAGSADLAPSPALATFFADGTFITSELPFPAAPILDATSPDASPSPAPAGSPTALLYPTVGQGVWTATGSGRAALTFVELLADGTGAFAVMRTVSATLKVDEAGDAMNGPYTVTSVGPDGQPLPDSSGTIHGTRVTIALIADFNSGQEPGTLDVAFVDHSTGDPTSWAWDFGDGHTGTNQNPTHGYAQPGVYQVSLTATNRTSTATKTRSITVEAVPAPVADFHTDQVAGTLEVQLKDVSTGDPTAWSWDFGDGTHGDHQNPMHTYAQAGDYQVKLIARNIGGSDSHTQKLTVKPVPAPVADFTAKQDKSSLAVKFTDTSTGAPTVWAWDFGDGTTGTRRNPVHTYQKAGDYQVKLIARNPGGRDEHTSTITVDAVVAPSPS